MESFCDLIVDHQQELWFLILYFRMPLGKSLLRELNGAEDSLHHKIVTGVMEQTIGNMVSTQQEFHASSANPL